MPNSAHWPTCCQQAACIDCKTAANATSTCNALEISQLTRKPRVTEEGARLLMAECALGDNDASRALKDLAEMLPASQGARKPCA